MTAVCTQNDVLGALIILRHTVPGDHPEISETTAAVWHAALALYSGDIVRDVALAWTGDRYPSREAFRDAVSAEQRTRAEAAAEAALDRPGQHQSCPECDGFGWKVLGIDPLWVVEPCPAGCQVPLPRHRRADGRARRRTASAPTGPRRVPADVVETTGRITGDRDDF
jgi:hypothetical protein